MYKKLVLGDIMTSPVTTVPVTTSLSDALEIMAHQRLSSLVIADDDGPVGIFTEMDVLKLPQSSLDGVSVSDFMSTCLIQAPATTEFRDGYQIISQRGIRHLLITDAVGDAVGLVSESDFIRNISSELLMGFRDVQSVMTTDLHTLPADALLDTAMDSMRHQRVSYVVVAAERRPLGIITLRDLVRLQQSNDVLASRTLQEVMRSPVKTTCEQTLLPEVLLDMERANVRQLVVTDADGYLAGLVSYHSLIGQLLDGHMDDLLLILECYGKDVREAEAKIRTHHELNEAKHRLSSVMNTLPYGIVECDLNGGVNYVNRSYQSLLGLQEADIIGQRIWNLKLNREDRSRIRAFFSSLDNQWPKPASYTAKYTNNDDGRELILAVVWNYQRDAQGNTVGITCVVSDITQQSQAEKVIKNRKVELEQIFTALPVALVFADAERRITRVNPAFTRMFQYTEEEVLGRSTAMFYESYDDFLEQGKLRFSKDCPSSRIAYELKYRKKDGTLFHSRSVGTAVKDSDGQVIGMLGLVEDITAEKRSDEYRQLVSRIFENTSEGIFITNARAEIVEVNQAFLDITGYQHEDVIGQNPRLLKSGHHDEHFYQQFWDALMNTGQWVGEVWNRRKDGAIYPEWQNINRVLDEQGEISHYISVFSDITSRKESKETIEHLAHYDRLTGLPNRLLLLARLDQALNNFADQQRPFCLITIDLDMFKDVNDGLGPSIGDGVLQDVAQRLQAAFKPSDCVARMDGDEFVVLVEGIDSVDKASAMLQRIMDLFRQPFRVHDQDVHLSASIGTALCPQDGIDKSDLLRNAESAMHQAKKEGRNTYCFYTSELTTQAAERIAVGGQLKGAIDRNELVLYYQPQVDLASRSIIGCEALLRWFSTELGFVPPDRFIPIAEDLGLIHEIGDWVLNTACRQARTWLDNGVTFGQVSVNVSGPEVSRGDLVRRVAAALETSGLSPEYLELEITETFIMQYSEDVVDQLQSLRELGVTLSIDDFGTGYSSLCYLRRLPVDKVKIDKSFVDDLAGDQSNSVIADAIIRMSKAMGLSVIAEGVEEEAQEAQLMALGCEQGQGYFYSRPVPAGEIRASI